MVKPVIKGSSNVLVNLPDLIQYGSKPSREIEKDPTLLEKLYGSFRSFDDFVTYPPNQVFIGNMMPEELENYERPWTDKKVPDAKRFSKWGEIVPEEEFYGWMKIADMFSLVWLEEGFLNEVVIPALKNHPLITEDDLEKIQKANLELSKIESKIADDTAIPLYFNEKRLAGCVEQGNNEDKYQTPEIMLENLSNKASGIITGRIRQ